MFDPSEFDATKCHRLIKREVLITSGPREATNINDIVPPQGNATH